MKNKLICLLASLFLISNITSSLYCQSSKNDISCTLIRNFLDTIKPSHFSRYLPKDTSLILLDPDNLMKKCSLQHWYGYRLSIVYKGALIDSIKIYNRHYVLKGRCQYLVLSKGLEEDSYYLNLHQPCSNVFSVATIKRRNYKCYIAKIEYGVF